MRKFILASHGNLAEGLKSSIEMISGKQENLYVINAYTSEDFDLSATIEEFFSTFENEDEIVVFTDIYGGSVNNEFTVFLSKYKFHLVTGMNLSLVLEILSKNNLPIEEVIDEALRISKESQVYVNQLSQLNDDEF